jgi:hypothetical protein
MIAFDNQVFLKFYLNKNYIPVVKVEKGEMNRGYN